MTNITLVPSQPNRATKKVSLVETFKIETAPVLENGVPKLGANGKPILKDVQITAFEEPGIFTPAVNPNYVFPKEELAQLLAAIENREPAYLVGHSGTGKTALVNQVAARLNYNVIQINFDGHLSRSDLIGDWRLIGGATVFKHGLVPTAFLEPGTLVLFDEIDACPPETAFVLQRALSEELRFLMHETGELISLHPQNSIIGTANTHGFGDDSGLYAAGTNIQNFSFLNRWPTVISVDYIPQAAEAQVLKAMFPTCHAFVGPVTLVLQAVRQGFKVGSISVPLTTRDGINWLAKIQRGILPMRAARFSFLDKLTPKDAMSIANIIARYFKLDARDDVKYVTSAKPR